MVSFESFNPEHVPKAKLATHSLQIVLAFVAWCMEIAVFANDSAKITGQIGWAFAVFFLSVPAWIYQIMTPRWERTRKLADPRAMLTVDALFTVIWLSAFASQAAYNSSGLCNEACTISKIIVGLGVVVTLLWGAALFVSFFTLQYWNFHGSLPGYDKRKLPGSNNIDPHKADFSMAPHDDEAYAPINMDERDPGRGDEYASGAYGGATYSNPHDTYDDGDAGHSGYGAGGGSAYGGSNVSGAGGNPAPVFDNQADYNAPAPARPYVAPTATDVYEDGPAQFPAANYDRVR